VTVTGLQLPLTELTDSGNTVAEASADVLAFCAERFGRGEADDITGAPIGQPVGLTHKQLQDALDVLDPSMPHDPWLRVGMALHHETTGDGFDLWDTWSSAGSTYPGQEALQRRWDSFGNGTVQVTAHALVRMANAAGAHIDLASIETADDFDVVAPATTATPAPDKPMRFAVEPLDAFVSRPAPQWIIKGVLPKADLIVLYGESTAGKSFAALDMACAIARGIEWRGHRVRQGRVLYIVAEGAGGFRNRVAAYCQHYGLQPADIDIGIIAAAPNLLQREDALDVAKAAIASGRPALVIIDTFAQTTPGANENAAEDMGKALTHARGIGTACRCPVLLVHHAGKDASRGARGWSGIKAAADAELEVTRTPTGGRAIRTTKQKDGEDGMAWGFDLQQVNIGLDDDGDVISSCVVVPAEAPPAGQVAEALRRGGAVTRAVIEVVSEFAMAQTTGIEVSAIVEAAAAKLPAPEDRKRDTRKQRVRRAISELCNGDDAPYLLGDDGCLSIL
jgi:hypothetical protein